MNTEELFYKHAEEVDYGDGKMRIMYLTQFTAALSGALCCDHVQPVVVPCDCATWGRDNLGAILYLEHHPNCKHYRPEPEIRALLQRLIDGIESWASDEDGVHPDCWDAYVKACGVCGQWSRPKASA